MRTLFFRALLCLGYLFFGCVGVNAQQDSSAQLTPENQKIIDQALAGDGTGALEQVPQSLVDWATSDATIDALINAEQKRQDAQRAYNRQLLASASLDPLGIKNACVGLYVADVGKGVLVGADFIAEVLFYVQFQKLLIDTITQVTLTHEKVLECLGNKNRPLSKPLMSFDELRMSGLENAKTINKTAHGDSSIELRTKDSSGEEAYPELDRVSRPARGEPVEPYERKFSKESNIDKDKQLLESCDFKAIYAEQSVVTARLMTMLLVRVGFYQGAASFRDYYMLNDTPQNFSDLVDHIIHPSPNPIPLFALLQMRPFVTLPSDLVQADISDIPVALAKEYGLVPEWLTGNVFEWSKQLLFYVFCMKTFYQNVILQQWNLYCTTNAELVGDSLRCYVQARQGNDYKKVETARNDVEMHVKRACKVPVGTWLGHKQGYVTLWNVACNTVQLVPALVKIALFGAAFYENIRKDQNQKIESVKA